MQQGDRSPWDSFHVKFRTAFCRISNKISNDVWNIRRRPRIIINNVHYIESFFLILIKCSVECERKESEKYKIQLNEKPFPWCNQEIKQYWLYFFKPVYVRVFFLSNSM